MSSIKKYIVIAAILLSSVALKAFGVDNIQEDKYATATVINNTPEPIAIAGYSSDLWKHSCYHVTVPPFETRKCTYKLPNFYNYHQVLRLHVPLRGGIFSAISINVPGSTLSCGKGLLWYIVDGVRERYNVEVTDDAPCSAIFKLNTNRIN